jgi:large repetitive protein
MKKKRPLRMECLERRELLAGNVNAAIDGQNILRITGDNASNQIHVQEVARIDGALGIRVIGINTNINGSSQAAEFRVPSRDVVISMGGGNDSVFFAPQAPSRIAQLRRLEIFGGPGQDRINVQRVNVSQGTVPLRINTGIDGSGDVVQLGVVTVGAGQDALVSTGGGNDQIRIGNSTFRRNLTINAGDGADTVNLVNAQVVGQFTLNAGTGADVVNLEATTLGGSAALNLGDGADQLLIRNNSRFNSRSVIRGGAGNDDIRLLNMSGTSIVVDAGDGANEITLRNAQFNGTGESSFLLGNQNGTFRSEASSFTGGVRLLLAGGNNAATISGGSAASLEITAGNGRNDITLNQRFSAQSFVRIATGSGDDTINVSELQTGSLTINAGDGTNTVALQEVGVAILTLDTGSGNDALSFMQVEIADHAQIRSGGGDDRISVVGGAAGLASIDVGTGNNFVQVMGDGPIDPNAPPDVEDLRLSGGADGGNVKITVVDAVFGSVTATLGGGDDELNVGIPLDVLNPPAVQGLFAAAASTGDVMIQGTLTIRTQQGDDRIRAGNVTVRGLAEIHGGPAVVSDSATLITDERFGSPEFLGGVVTTVNVVIDDRAGVLADANFVAPPIFSRPGGVIEQAVDIRIAAPEGATVRFTLDGSLPSATQGAVLGPSGVVRVQPGQTLRAVATFLGRVSSVTTATFARPGQVTGDNVIIDLDSGANPTDFLRGRTVKSLVVRGSAAGRSLVLEDLIVEDRVVMDFGGGANRLVLRNVRLPANTFIRFGAGNDVVVLENVGLADNGTIDLGDGDNVLSVSNIAFSRLNLIAGSGRDKFDVANLSKVVQQAGQARVVAADRLFMSLGAGNDEVNLTDAVLLETAIRLGDGADRLVVDGVGRGALSSEQAVRNRMTIDGGNGNDTLLLNDIEVFFLEVLAGPGDDRLVTSNLGAVPGASETPFNRAIHRLNIDLGAGNNTWQGERIQVRQFDIAGPSGLFVRGGNGRDQIDLSVVETPALTMNLGGGNDLLILRDKVYVLRGTTFLNGGEGNDELRIGRTVGLQSPQFLGFEIVTRI